MSECTQSQKVKTDDVKDHSQKKDIRISKNNAVKLNNLGPYVCVALLVIFGILTILYMRLNYDKYDAAIRNYPGSVAELRIADMQAVTLAVATLVVTLAGVTLTVLSILRERKNDALERKIETQIEKLSEGENELERYRERIIKAESEIRDIANLASIQYIGEDQRECYFDIISQHINDRIENHEGQLLEENHLIIRISLLSNLAKHENSVRIKNANYDLIVNYAEKIRNSVKATKTEKEIAVLETLHALYQQIKIDIDHNPANADSKIKMALTGNGGASKEQVAGMLQRLLKIPNDEMGKYMDATDALAAAYCHFLQMGRPESDVKYRGWKDFINKNQDKVSKRKEKA